MVHGENLSQQLIGCAINVSNILGSGFLENVYEHALCVELTEAGIAFTQQQKYEVNYRNRIIGKYFADIVVGDKLLVELKALSGLNREHEAQVMNYLKASGLSVGILLNFGTPKLGIKRIVWQCNHSDII